MRSAQGVSSKCAPSKVIPSSQADRSGSSDITALLAAWRGGNKDALTELLPKVYKQLKKIAGNLMRGESRAQTLHATALVHEAYLRVVDLERVDWRSRAHFFAMCARLMRRVLVEHARYHGREKRGGEAQRIDLGSTGLDCIPVERTPDLLALDQALLELSRHDLQRARVVELRYFGGLDREEIAEVLGISSATVTRRWRSARAWLIHYLGADRPPTSLPDETGAGKLGADKA